MADLDIAIAGRSYRVACADGEEENLTEAARLVAAEAESLREQFGTRFAALPETRMLLMASLMLGDRFRAHLAEEAAAFGDAPAGAEAVRAETGGPSQSGFFDDPVQTARIAELEAALAAARDSELAALAALEEAAERIRALAGEIAEGEALDDDEADEEEAEDDDAGEPDEDLDGALDDDLADDLAEDDAPAPEASDDAPSAAFLDADAPDEPYAQDDDAPFEDDDRDGDERGDAPAEDDPLAPRG
ncbi:cell division protein ZapA [Albimonas pacifica]|uniref:Cell division protein ZapA n=1 Tax=Albimonas pacifica TaxID=1114924 RepID=A0A1I3HXX1_9RHOB|nr:cell division protein ZapA [Albimonas pacifica]SFI40608.1 Cell division protein ZapA [Albimonas pacifica]